MPPKSEVYTFAQVKEIIKSSEDTMMKFFNSTVDRLEGKILTLTEENLTIKRELSEVKESLQFHSDMVEQKLKQVESKKDVLEEKETMLEKMAELEDRSRRNNLRFSGIEGETDETWERSEQKVREMLKEKLGIDHDVKIERAHRSGRIKYDDGEINTKRTIIAKFLDYKEKKCILDAFREKQLWKKKIYVNEDFSQRTLSKRRELFKKVKDLRDKGIKAKVIYNKIIFQESILNDTEQIDPQHES